MESLKPVNVSYTSLIKYMTCPEEYNLHYNHKIRADYTNSALPFGNALDLALQELLKSTSTLEDAIDVFNGHFEYFTLNGTELHLPKSDKVAYHNKDLDEDLLGENEQKLIADGYHPAWCSLRRKGHIMLESFKVKVLPNIKEVLAVQPELEIENAHGDKIIGKADVIVRWEDNTVRLIDFKSSTMLYQDDSVQNSSQLAIYEYGFAQKYNIDLCSYIVFSKVIKKNKTKICSKCDYDGSEARHLTCPNKLVGKRCDGAWATTIDPECYIQVIAGQIPETFVDATIENANRMADGIKKGVYYRNYGACIRAYGPCPMYNVCHGGDMKGMIKK